jgi:hypothetical protein
MTNKITDEMVREYVGECAISIIEDDMNESGDFTEEEHEELIRRAFQWIADNC